MSLVTCKVSGHGNAMPLRNGDDRVYESFRFATEA